MVKIKAGMSADSSDGEGEALAAVKDKLKIQQRLIDISARSLLSSRSSTADLSQSFESQSALEVQRENSSLQEVRLQTSPQAVLGRSCLYNTCTAMRSPPGDGAALFLIVRLREMG